MLNKIASWFWKEGEDKGFYLPKDEEAKFSLMLGELSVGSLECKNGNWKFIYSDEFKHQDEYNPVPGFSDINKVYKNNNLWPFFQIRIPGLGQPKVRCIIEEEKLDKENEAVLLKRFGYKTISNPFILSFTG